jgi:hypothetical protein
MNPKLSRACYAVRSMVHISNIYTHKSIYYVYFHSIIKYGVILWGSSSNNGKIFTLRKKIQLWLVHNPEPLLEVYLNS